MNISTILSSRVYRHPVLGWIVKVGKGYYVVSLVWERLRRKIGLGLLLLLAVGLAQAEPLFMVIPTATYAPTLRTGATVLIRSTDSVVRRFDVLVAYRVGDATRLFQTVVERGNNPVWPPYDTHAPVPLVDGDMKVLTVRVTEHRSSEAAGPEYGKEYGGNEK